MADISKIKLPGGATYDIDAVTVNGHTVGADVPVNAKFTDTTYSNMSGATASAAGKSGLVPAPASGTQKAFLCADGSFRYAAKWDGRVSDTTFLNNAATIYPYMCSISGTEATAMGLPSAWWHLVYIPHHDPGYGFQIALPLNSANLPRYRRVSSKNTWTTWFVENAGRTTGGRIPTLNASGALWDDDADNINDLYIQWDATNQYFKLKTYGGNNVAVDIATSGSSSQHQIGTTPTLTEGTKTNINISFDPKVVLLLVSGHVITAGYAIVMGTKSFAITPASLSIMGTTRPQYIAFS